MATEQETIEPQDETAIGPDDVIAASDNGTPETDIAEVETTGLPVVHSLDASSAARGRRWFEDRVFGRGLIPELALRHLYLTWGVGDLTLFSYYTSATKYWPAFHERYGSVDRADPAEKLPVGFRRADDGLVTFDCLLCHASRAGGQVAFGASSSRLDLQGLHDDLVALPAAVTALQERDLPEPYASALDALVIPSDLPTFPEMKGRTLAAGVTDAMGLALALAKKLAPETEDVHTDLAGQDAPAWWTAKHVDRFYTDGSGKAPGHRSMMSMLLAFGLTRAEYIALEKEFDDIAQAVLAAEAPRWAESGYDPPDPAAVSVGRGLFGEHCASCHGDYDGPDASFPNRIVSRAEIGTDPIRSERFGQPEVDLSNAATQDPAHPLMVTGGYLAPALTGIWASAPYFHNGSVPTLAGVLDPDVRPARWRRTGADPEDYDPVAVGWRVEPDPAAATPSEVRRVVDTSRDGLSNAGHLYGSDLTEADRAALLAYLKTL